MQPDALGHALRRLAGANDLTSEEAGAAFDAVMSGLAPPTQVAALLMGLRVKGETPDEVTGAVRAVRRAMLPVPYTRRGPLVDTCGTGGGAFTTFNISTAAALLAAGAGVIVAKHGNRSFTTQCGSADVLEALGISIDLTPEQMAGVLDEVGIVFMFAPTMHPAMRHAGPVRRELSIPTIMNLVGPLANPAGASRQVVGVSTGEHLALVAGALAALGTEHALVVFGEPGMDEISPLSRTHVLEVRNGHVTSREIIPEVLGIGALNPEDLRGGTPAENAATVREVLSGRGSPGARSAVLLNAAAAIYVGGLRSTYEDSFEFARTALEEGRGTDALERLKSAQRRNAV